MKVAWLQYDIVWQDSAKNIQVIEDILKNSSKDFDLLVLPEMFDTGFAMHPQKIQRNQEEIKDQLRSWSKRFQCGVVASTIWMDGNYKNRLFYIDIIQDKHYDKVHLFAPGGESENYQAGSKYLEVVGPHQFKIRPLICYDLRFPEIARNTSDYDLLIYVANWPKDRIDQWYDLLKARAIENQSFVLGVNRIGKDGNSLGYNGQSVLFDFKGKELLNAQDQEGLYQFEMTKEPMRAYREKLPFLKDIKLID